MLNIYLQSVGLSPGWGIQPQPVKQVPTRRVHTSGPHPWKEKALALLRSPPQPEAHHSPLP